MFLAHISNDGRKQTIKEHLTGASILAKKFASSFHMQDEAEYIGLLHDIGKYSKAFQKRLEGGPKVDHSTAGAYEALKDRDILAAFCIAGHHSGLPDGGRRVDLEGSSLLARKNRASKGLLENYDVWKDEIFVDKFKHEYKSDILSLSYMIRMLYSCLVDADYLDTERFMSGEIQRGRKYDAEQMDHLLMKYIRPWFPAQNELNRLRCEILKKAIQAGENSKKGLFSMTVPTGGGKTVASLAFAIKHAKAHKMDRIIYVIPYTSIIEQTADVFRNIVGEENVLEHHSGVELSENEDSLFYMRSAENWDMPVIVTTAVQFFESFYKNKSSSSRKLHNVANSVVIFDEAQMMPSPYIRPCVRLITELVKNFETSAVLCTATQPALNGLIEEYMTGKRVTEICPDALFNDPLFKRVTFCDVGTISEEKLANELNTLHQVLCIVNSRKIAQTIFDLLEDEGSYHLSTFMYPEHRKRILKEIRNRLKEGKTCRVVSTSLIEAGVDVDFPCVYRQMAGLDSILQAGGRCNREGKRIKEKSLVNIFELQCGSPEIFSMQIAASRQVFKKKPVSITESWIEGKEAVQEYFDNLFYLKGKTALDQYNILDRMLKENLPFASISKDFNLIDSNTRTLYIETDENADEIFALRHGFITKKDYRNLGLYSINLYEYQFEKLKNNYSIELLDDGNCILLDSSLYSSDTGLSLNLEIGEAIFI